MEIPPAEWDSIGGNQRLFSSHRFLRVVESSGVEDAQFFYLMFYDGEALVAGAVLSTFILTLDLLLPPSIQKACAMIRRVIPGFMRIRTLFCGLPVSIGKHTLLIAVPSRKDAVLHALVKRMGEICRDEGIRYCCLKEFPAREADNLRALEAKGFFAAYSIPRIDLPVRWDSYAEYLASLRHGYRRQIRKNLDKISADINNPFSEGCSDDISSLPHLAIVDANICPPELFHRLYLEVMTRTDTRLETLNEAFFQGLYKELGEHLVILAMVQESAVLGAVLLTDHDDTLTFLFAGIDYSRRDEFDVYINLLHGIAAYGIDQDCKNIDMGQTSYWSKRRIGGQASHMIFWFRALNPLLHTAIQGINPALFPDTVLPPLRVFRDSAAHLSN
jgi:predicted N-acyltransferase